MAITLVYGKLCQDADLKSAFDIPLALVSATWIIAGQVTTKPRYMLSVEQLEFKSWSTDANRNPLRSRKTVFSNVPTSRGAVANFTAHAMALSIQGL